MAYQNAVVGRHLRWISRALFCMNLAFIIVWADEQNASGSWVLGILEYPMYRFLYRFLRQIQPNFTPSRGISFITLWLLSAAVTLLILSLFTRLISNKAVFRAERLTALVIAVVGFPLVCLYVRGTLGLTEAQVRWLVFEALAILICAILYVARRWLAPIGLTVFLFIAHLALWSWVISVQSSLWFVFPLLGFSSGIAAAKEPQE